MTPALLLDIGHIGKASSADLGARPLGPSQPWQAEASLATGYALEVYALLRDRLPVRFVGFGNYSDRWARANSVARLEPLRRWLYLSCHLDYADAGGRGLVLFDERSVGGRIAAEAMAPTMARYMPDLVELRTVPLRRDGTWRERGLSVISGIYDGPRNISGVVVEPCGVAHGYAQQPARVGEAVAEGVMAWAAMQTPGVTSHT